MDKTSGSGISNQSIHVWHLCQTLFRSSLSLDSDSTIEYSGITLIRFFFFLISKNFIYTNGYSVQEKHRANPEKTSIKQRENEKEPNNKKKLQKRKRTKKRRERVTSCESPSLRPIKKSPTKRSKNLINGTIQILKSPPIPFLPDTPKAAQWN